MLFFEFSDLEVSFFCRKVCFPLRKFFTRSEFGQRFTGVIMHVKPERIGDHLFSIHGGLHERHDDHQSEWGLSLVAYWFWSRVHWAGNLRPYRVISLTLRPPAQAAGRNYP